MRSAAGIIRRAAALQLLGEGQYHRQLNKPFNSTAVPPAWNFIFLTAPLLEVPLTLTLTVTHTHTMADRFPSLDEIDAGRLLQAEIPPRTFFTDV